MRVGPAPGYDGAVIAIVTGMNGTVAPELARVLESVGYVVVPWVRDEVPIDDPVAVREFIGNVQPDWFCHVALGSPDWAEWAAAACDEFDIGFLFTSSVSVYASSQVGPFSIADVPEPNDDYGRYKLMCEHRVRLANPEARIARLGWQIGTAPGNNNMVDFLHRQHVEHGHVDASRNWIPSCSMLADTAESLRILLETQPAGLYHLEGNPGLSFFEIAVSLNRLRGNPWTIVPMDAPVMNNLMRDDRVDVRPITDTLSPSRA